MRTVFSMTLTGYMSAVTGDEPSSRWNEVAEKRSEPTFRNENSGRRPVFERKEHKLDKGIGCT